jgi:hypothetical protein
MCVTVIDFFNTAIRNIGFTLSPVLPLIFSGYLIMLAGCTGPPMGTDPEASDTSRSFDQTKYMITGDFLRFYEIYGGQASLGLPVSGEMIESGWRVQYFEYGRLEYHPENQPTYRITVGWLGDLLNRRQPPLPPSGIPPVGHPDYRYYGKTGHSLSGDFLRFFDANGGSVRFGLPISEPFLLNGQLTQDFQSARFFWSPRETLFVKLEPIGLTHLMVISPSQEITVE